MQVVEASEGGREAWDRFVQGSSMGSFLQSWAWGTVQQAAGFLVVRLVVQDQVAEDTVRAVCLLVQRPLPFRRSYFVAPWGPVLNVSDRSPLGPPDDPVRVFGALAEALRSRFGRDVIFTRIEPRLSPNPKWQRIFDTHGFLLSQRNIQPKDTLVIDLTQSEDDLLRAMHPKTRYNIRVAQRHGVKVETRSDAEGLRTFLSLAREVERRGKFRYHPDGYYAAMLRALVPAGMLEILLATLRGQPLAAGLLIRFGGSVTYAHGASSEQRKQVMAPHLLQWEAMLRAKAQGSVRYDLFGVAPPGASSAHPWFGMTRFKRGFGGTEEHYVGAADLVEDTAFYRAYEIGRNLRALLR